MAKAFFIFLLAASLSGCATILGGRHTPRPQENEPKRKIRWGFFCADLIFFAPGLAVDFATGSIYRAGVPTQTKTE
jgi:hypothetical protein